MRYPVGDDPLIKHLHDTAHHPAAFKHKFYLIIQMLHPARPVFIHRSDEGIEALERMVKIGDRTEQILSREIIQQPLETAKTAAHLLHLIGAGHNIKRPGILYIGISAPHFALRVLVKVAATTGGDQFQHTARRILMVASQRGAQMVRDR